MKYLKLMNMIFLFSVISMIYSLVGNHFAAIVSLSLAGLSAIVKSALEEWKEFVELRDYAD